MDDVELGHRLEQLAAQLVRAAVARRRVVQLPGPRLRERDEILDVLHRQRRMRRQHVGHADHQRDRREIPDRVVRQLGVNRRVGAVAGVGPHQQRIAVGRGAGRNLGADRAAGARARVVDHGLAEAFAHFLTEHAGEQIGLGARRLGDHDTHRLGRVILRQGRAHARSRQSCEPDKDCGVHFLHVFLPGGTANISALSHPIRADGSRWECASARMSA
ncbi:hypothetical protein D3C83_03860 [compost metagenome]